MRRLKPYLFFLLFVFAYSFSSAQKSGFYIRNYLPKEYKGFNQTWQATQDKNGVMYFAGTSNVFVLTGKYWKKIPVKSGFAIRQIILDSADNTIYLGIPGDFGYLDRNATGELHYVSMLDQLSNEQKNFTDVWKIFYDNGSLYFQSSEYIFIVRNKKLAGVIEAPHDKTFALAFQAGGRLYVRQRTVGLMLINNKKLSLIPGGELFADKRVLGIIPFSKSEDLIVTGDEGFYKISPDNTSGNTVSFFKTDDYLKNSAVLGCRWVNDSMFSVFSRAGIAFYDRNGNFSSEINKSSGLSDESVTEVFVDHEKSLWLMHNNGISRIEYNSSSYIYDDNIGYKGTPEFVRQFSDGLYLGTGIGFYKLVENTSSHTIKAIATPVKNTECWDAIESNNILFVGTSSALMGIKNGVELTLSDYYTTRIVSIQNTDKLFAAEKGGYSIIGFKAGTPYVMQHYEVEGEELLKVGKVIPSANFPGFYETWAISRQKKVLHLRFSLSENNSVCKKYSSVNGVPDDQNYIVNMNDSAYLTDLTDCYRYVPALDKSVTSVCFLPAPDIFKALKSNTSAIQPPVDFGFCLHDTGPYSVCFGYDANGKVFSRRIMFGALFEENTLQYAFIQPNGRLIALNTDFICTYNTNTSSDTTNSFQTVINKVTIGKDSLIFSGSDEREINFKSKIRYTSNSIVFNFDAPEFRQNNQLYFEYRLDGYDTAWSNPSLASEKSFTNMYEGTYTFRVKCFDSYGKTSSEATFTFVISPPWYRTYLAYFIYFLIFILVIYFLVRISAMRLRRQKEKLEILVKERTAEVVSQKQMLETAYVEIKDSIRYAKRIQNALLASSKLLTEHLKEYFIYYKPKDIVSGDFYWAQPKGDWLYMITADCTGHGVPGAFMSLLNISFLNEAINGTEFITPDRILGEVRARIIDALRTDGSEEGGKDGMDCVLCAYNFKTHQLMFSTANNPLWVWREKNIIEFKPDKYPVGKHDRENEPFHLYTIDLKSGDIIYTFTDGYADQFGGVAGKKFKVKQLKELLLSIAHLPMNEQKDVVSKTIRKWKKGIEQIDDILVVGVRVQ